MIMIKFINLNNIIENGEISESNCLKMKKQHSYLIKILSNNSSKYGDPYLCGFMEDKGWGCLGYKDEFELHRMLIDLQDYVFVKRNELRGE